MINKNILYIIIVEKKGINMEYKDVYKIFKEFDFVIIYKSGNGLFERRHYYENAIWSLNHYSLGKACVIDFGTTYMWFGGTEYHSFSLQNGYNIEDYDKFKKFLDSNQDMYCCIYTDIFISRYYSVKDVRSQVYIYFNKNKFELNFRILEPSKMRSVPGQTTYHMNIKNIEGTSTYRQPINIVLDDINTLLHSLDTLNCDEKLKSKYYKQLVKSMCIRGNFKDRYEEVISFEDKIKILSEYEEITKAKEQK